MNTRIIREITDFLFIQDELKPSDILFLPGNNSVELPEAGAKAYHAGLAPLIMCNGRFSVKTGRFTKPNQREEIYPPPYTTEAEFFKQVLTYHGVPEEAIITESFSGYTKQNGEFAREILHSLGIYPKTALIICRSVHARRCLQAYQFHFPDTTFFVRGVDCHNMPFQDSWWTTEAGVSAVMSELRKCGEQFEKEMVGYGGKVERLKKSR